jgi:hypothetical protein
MKEHAEHMLPGGMEVKVLSIDKLDQYEEPLAVTLSVKGPIGSATGKRLLLTGDLFECNSKPTFSRDKREMAVYFPYRYNARDAIRINLPPGFQVESVPTDKEVKMSKVAAYDIKSVADGTGVTIRRNLVVGEIVYLPAEYPDLKAFYGQFEAKDQEPVILKVAGVAQASAGASSVESITLPATQTQTQKP